MRRLQDQQSRMNWRSIMLGLVGFMFAFSPTTAQTLTSFGRKPTRIIHQFDFNERIAGNLEDLPKYWIPLRPRKFPHYTSGKFDFEEGHFAAPSFHLLSEGRNVAYQYVGLDTRILTNTDYRIEAYIRPDRLKNARVCLSGHFIDEHGKAMPNTLVRSRYISSEGLEENEWVKVELFLSSPPSRAYTIGLVAWVLQEPAWQTNVMPKRHISRVDVFGGAWFDDITIYSLPRAEIKSSESGNVLTGKVKPELYVLLADYQDKTLEGILSIRAADGGLVETHPIGVVVDENVEPVHISVQHLSPGIYHARLEVFSGKKVIITRSLTFARMMPIQRESELIVRSFGVVVDPRYRTDADTEISLLTHQAVRSVKLPVWTGLSEEVSTLRQRRETDRLLQKLTKNGFALTGVLFGPPGVIVRNSGPYVRPLIDLLGDNRTLWEEHLATVLAANASAYRNWQIGGDGQSKPVEPQKFKLATSHLRDAMRRYMTAPVLLSPVSTEFEKSLEKLPVDQITLSLEDEFPREEYRQYLKELKKQRYDRVSVYIDPLNETQYERIPRLANWAQRVLMAKHAGASTVYVPQTWRVNQTSQGPVVEPRETYILLRTIANAIGDAMPGPVLNIAEGVYALTFHQGDQSVLALWDEGVKALEGRDHLIQLGSASTMVDLWGNEFPLPRDETGRQIVHLTSLPIFIRNVDRWLIDFQSAFVINPNHIVSGMESADMTIEAAYQGTRPVAGRIVLQAPDSWEIVPSRLNFSIMPQRMAQFKIQVRFPHSEPAGKKTILMKITLPDSSHYMEVPLTFDLGLSDVEVWGMAVVEGDDLHIRHVVTNQSQEVLSFRGSAMIPGRERQYRPFVNLQPGDTQIVEYRINKGANLIGRHVRLVLREMNDGPRVHNLDLLVP